MAEVRDLERAIVAAETLETWGRFPAVRGRVSSVNSHKQRITLEFPLESKSPLVYVQDSKTQLYRDYYSNLYEIHYEGKIHISMSMLLHIVTLLVMDGGLLKGIDISHTTETMRRTSIQEDQQRTNCVFQNNETLSEGCVVAHRLGTKLGMKVTILVNDIAKAIEEIKGMKEIFPSPQISCNQQKAVISLNEDIPFQFTIVLELL